MVECWSVAWAFFEHAPFHVWRPGWLSRHDRNMTLSPEVVRERVKPAVAEKHWLAGVRQRLQPLHTGQQGHLHRREPPVVVAASSAATRASISSISMALAAWLKIESATRARTDAGGFGSMRRFRRVVAAPERPCWSRAMDWPNAARRACRYAVWNSGTFSHRRRVAYPMPAVRAASSTFRWVSKAAFASSI